MLRTAPTEDFSRSGSKHAPLLLCILQNKKIRLPSGELAPAAATPAPSGKLAPAVEAPTASEELARDVADCCDGKLARTAPVLAPAPVSLCWSRLWPQKAHGRGGALNLAWRGGRGAMTSVLLPPRLAAQP